MSQERPFTLPPPPLSRSSASDRSSTPTPTFASSAWHMHHTSPSLSPPCSSVSPSSVSSAPSAALPHPHLLPRLHVKMVFPGLAGVAHLSQNPPRAAPPQTAGQPIPPSTRPFAMGERIAAIERLGSNRPRGVPDEAPGEGRAAIVPQPCTRSPRPGHSDRDLYRRGGGAGSEAKKKSLCSERRPPISGPFDKNLFFPEKNCLMWAGGGLARAEEPSPPFRPPPPGNAKPWLAHGPSGACARPSFV